MRKIINGSIFIFIISLLLAGCSSGSDEPKMPAEKERLVLVYAIAANNLEQDLLNPMSGDMKEMLEAGPQLNLESNAVLVYYVDRQGVCRLSEMRKTKGGDYEFATVQEFPSLPLSTSGERISEVIDYVKDNYDYPAKGLVLWSHADGWLPWFAGSTPSFAKKKSYGWDDFEGGVYKTNITTLAEAIPENTFDYIWFDCCYMANIETVYQLRNKADYIVGSVLEIASAGMPYNLTMPYLVSKNADLKGAANQFFSYYDRRYIPVSVSIMDCNELDYLAMAASEIFDSGSVNSMALRGVQTYQRSLSEKFYDMGQLLLSYSDITAEEKETLADAFAKTVIYKLISDRDFNGYEVNVKDYSGLSMHNYVDNGSANNEFYKQLDWFMATRP